MKLKNFQKNASRKRKECRSVSFSWSLCVYDNQVSSHWMKNQDRLEHRPFITTADNAMDVVPLSAIRPLFYAWHQKRKGRIYAHNYLLWNHSFAVLPLKDKLIKDRTKFIQLFEKKSHLFDRHFISGNLLDMTFKEKKSISQKKQPLRETRLSVGSLLHGEHCKSYKDNMNTEF